MYEVIIVEDDPMVAMINGQYVNQNPHFHVAATCRDGISAMEFLRANTVHLAILDVFMPRISGMELLRPSLVLEGVKPVGRAVLATVQGDMHDVGKNLVRMMMEGRGFEVIDLGVNVSAAAVVEAVRIHRPQILALSALLTSTMDQQRVVIEALMDAGLRDTVKVLVGGAPITQAFCELIGADGYAPDAAGAAELAKQMVCGFQSDDGDILCYEKCDILQKKHNG